METWFGKKDKGRGCRTFDSWESMVTAWYGATALLLSVTNGESYQWNLEMDPIPSMLVYWMHKDMEANRRR